jgi:hypothetical protein
MHRGADGSARRHCPRSPAGGAGEPVANSRIQHMKNLNQTLTKQTQSLTQTAQHIEIMSNPISAMIGVNAVLMFTFH